MGVRQAPHCLTFTFWLGYFDGEGRVAMAQQNGRGWPYGLVIEKKGSEKGWDKEIEISNVDRMGFIRIY
jgi:hypothetical protein